MNCASAANNGTTSHGKARHRFEGKSATRVLIAHDRADQASSSTSPQGTVIPPTENSRNKTMVRCGTDETVGAEPSSRNVKPSTKVQIRPVFTSPCLFFEMCPITALLTR